MDMDGLVPMVNWNLWVDGPILPQVIADEVEELDSDDSDDDEFYEQDSPAASDDSEYSDDDWTKLWFLDLNYVMLLYWS